MRGILFLRSPDMAFNISAKFTIYRTERNIPAYSESHLHIAVEQRFIRRHKEKKLVQLGSLMSIIGLTFTLKLIEKCLKNDFDKCRTALMSID